MMEQVKKGAWRGKVELLAPAGNLEKLQAAILYGADAVYMAGKAFGLRAFSKNFTAEEMFEARRLCTQHQVKMYITCNIMAHPEHMAELDEYIAFLKELKPDAVIISDPGIAFTFSQQAPELERHISTQASITNAQACQFWYQTGVKRIILARELDLAAIGSIAASVPRDLDLETFVHGAMCMAYSGRCILSNMLTGRGANQGECAQPCRWEYKLIERKRSEQALKKGENPEDNYQFSVEEDQHGSYFMSSKDLCMIEHVPELVEAGVTSFKIEGRMKGAYYVAMTVRAYRQALDAYLQDPEHYEFNPAWLHELQQMTHREYGTGFYFNKPQEEAQVAPHESYQKEATIVGRVLANLPYSPEERQPLAAYVYNLQDLGKKKQRQADKEGNTYSVQALPAGRYAILEERNFLDSGELIEFIPPRGEVLPLEVKSLYDANGCRMERINQAKQVFYVAIPQTWPDLPVGTFVRKAEKL